MRKSIGSLLPALLVLNIGNLQASCIEEEMRKQMLDMHSYVPSHLIHPLEENGILLEMKLIVADPEKWKFVHRAVEGYSRQFAMMADDEKKAKKENLVLRWRANKLQEFGVWEMVIGQSALRCLEKGVDP